ncbi:hypothetical protein EV702DRAFT_1042477 [Suillus placidus]|uniref:Zn(2)-C6 fungal-type domain-containing protein n=1 Tax=Suillus placidus TaxID=48579 RepID=A0A9P7A2W6_9AGAM|nr:hypothetical protein EV702DRAFT_1042477 [Suillus placidus]
MAFPFDSAVVLSAEAESLQRGFEELREKMAAEAKCVSEDCANLAVEKEECPKSDIGHVIASGREKGVVLALTSEEVARGKETAGIHDGYVEQLRALKSEAARQAEIKSQQIVPADVSMEEEDDDKDGEDEDSVKHPLHTRKSKAPAPTDSDGDGIVIHETLCMCCAKKNLECAGPEGQGCTECWSSKQHCMYSRQALSRTKLSAPPAASVQWSTAGLKASSRGSEDAPSMSRALKMQGKGRKRKLAEVEEDDFALADSGLRRDDLVMARKLRGVYVKFRTIQGLMSEVANELDMMRAHVTKKSGPDVRRSDVQSPKSEVRSPKSPMSDVLNLFPH